MRVSDRDLADLRFRNETDVRAWLRQHQPEAGDAQALWWENFMTRALQCVYQAEGESDRREYARLAHVATEEAIRQSVMDERDGIIRMANLAAFYLSAGAVESAPFDIDLIVTKCLNLIEIPLDVAIEQVRNWRALPVDQIRALRAAKNLLIPCEQISERLTDPSLIYRLSGWLTILGTLP